MIDPKDIKWNKVEVENALMIDWTMSAELIGTFLKKTENVGENNSNIYAFKKLNGTVVRFWGNTLLDARLETAEVGDFFKIVYLGKKKSEKTGRTFHNYDVFQGESKETTEKDIPIIDDDE